MNMLADLLKKINHTSLEEVFIIGYDVSLCDYYINLFINKTFPDLKITLIESKEIGILGAGEGSTPHLINFLDSF